jgi:hypothetical protein
MILLFKKPSYILLFFFKKFFKFSDFFKKASKKEKNAEMVGDHVPFSALYYIGMQRPFLI